MADEQRILPPAIVTKAGVDVSGNGYLAGEAPHGRTTANGVAVSAQIEVFYPLDNGDWQRVALTTSAVDGTWQIVGLNPDKKFNVFAKHQDYGGVVVVGVSPTRTDIITASGSFDVDSVDAVNYVVDGLIKIVGGLPPYVLTIKSPLPFGLNPIIDGRSLIIDGSSSDYGLWEPELNIKSSNNIELDIKLDLPIGFRAPEAHSMRGSDSYVRFSIDANEYATIEIYLSEDGSTFELIETLAPGSIVFTYTNVIAGDFYLFKLRAIYKGYSKESGSFLIQASGVVSAVGGVVTEFYLGLQKYRVHTFLDNGTLEIQAGGEVEVLLVGGGGSGGAHNTGGGGGAGRVVRKSLEVESGTYSVVVGIGGPAVSNSKVGNDGGPSSLFDITAPGGGGGGRGGYVTTAAASPNDKGRDGGSGGGGGGTWGGHIEPGGAALAERIELDEDLGHNGGRGMNGASTALRAGAGGGGAGGNGEDAVSSRGGYGGEGVLSDFDGTDRWLAAGGQGGTNGSGTRKRTNDIGGSGASSTVAATAGEDGTGSGGGGAREGSAALQTAGRGGKGRVAIRYKVPG